jgi:hydrogenase maturation protease
VAATGDQAVTDGVGPAAGVLVVGYGNSLRSDDGVGHAVADRLAADPRLRGAEVRTQHQLTPELALDASRASLLVLIDAADDVPPGDVAIRDLAPGSRGGNAGVRAGRSGEGGPPFTHNVDPVSVVTLAAELWGSAPRTVLVGIGPSSLELGDRLTPVASAAVPVAVETVVAAVAEWRAMAARER